jgi:hypothetical protein
MFIILIIVIFVLMEFIHLKKLYKGFFQVNLIVSLTPNYKNPSQIQIFYKIL